MNRRPPPRGSRPSPSRDWRAVAANRPQRTLGLPVRTSADTATDTARRAVSEAPDDADVPDDLADDGLELRVRERPGGARYATLVGSLATDDPAVLDALGDRLHAAARAVEGSDS